MKALIFNSGIGKRMGELTKNTHKSLAILNDGETILERQIRILSECGINEFVITTGPYEEKLKAVCNKYKSLKFHFVHNEMFDQTNYIYSFYLTKDLIDDDFLVLHGDLVFNKKLVIEILKQKGSIGLINTSITLPEKDFKARVINGMIKEVSIHIFDSNCFAFQPFYKLEKCVITAWIKRVSDFVKNGNVTVYAENALNEITDNIKIKALHYDNYFIDEIDNVDDYHRVTNRIRLFDFDEQEQYTSIDAIKSLKKPLIVVDNFLESKFSSYKTFSDFKPNPVYEDVLKGLKAFEGCDSIVSIGGGSSIDTAKAIKYYSCINDNDEFEYKNIKHYAVPTTAGTGSESTRYAVIYKNGVKQSLTHDSIFPDAVIFDSQFIITLPVYQKKCTLLDALCQAIESIWSVNATMKSIEYAQMAISLIKSNYKAYLDNDHVVIPNIQRAANLSGKAINISQTTAAHAMSYKITSLYGIPHGLAVAMSLPFLWELLISNKYEKLDYLNITLNEFKDIFEFMGINKKLNASDTELANLVESVNIERLSNFPLKLDKDTIKNIYNKL